jgi:hypothetical protein
MNALDLLSLGNLCSAPNSPENLDRVRSPEISYEVKTLAISPSSQMKHLSLKWNPATQEWFCAKCGRTSDHISVQDAQVELDQYDCEVPAVEMPEPWSGESS